MQLLAVHEFEVLGGSEVKTFVYQDAGSSCAKYQHYRTTSHVVADDINTLFLFKCLSPFSQKNKGTELYIDVFVRVTPMCVCVSGCVGV